MPRTSDLDSAELVAGELIANAVRHGAPPFGICIDWHDDPPILCVVDRGRGMPPVYPAPEPLSECGRGLLIVRALAGDIVVDTSGENGSGTRVVVALPVRRRDDRARRVAAARSGALGDFFDRFGELVDGVLDVVELRRDLAPIDLARQRIAHVLHEGSALDARPHVVDEVFHRLLLLHRTKRLPPERSNQTLRHDVRVRGDDVVDGSPRAMRPAHRIRAEEIEPAALEHAVPARFELKRSVRISRFPQYADHLAVCANGAAAQERRPRSTGGIKSQKRVQSGRPSISRASSVRRASSST